MTDMTLTMSNNTLASSEMALTMSKMAATISEMASSMSNTSLTTSVMASTISKLSSSMSEMSSTMSKLEKGLTGHDQQIQNLTATMTILMDNVANRQQSQQLNITSQRLPVPVPVRDCQDIAAAGHTISGHYIINPQDGLEPFSVYCELETNRSGWTVFQRRFNGSVDFDRDLQEYENGFGKTDGEYWLGLRNIHRLTMNGRWSLLVDLETNTGDKKYAF